MATYGTANPVPLPSVLKKKKRRTKHDRVVTFDLPDPEISEEDSAPKIENESSEDTPLISPREESWFSRYMTTERKIYICFLCLGLGCLLPWNFYITAESYWQYKFRDTDVVVDNLYSNDGFQTSLQSLYTPLLVSLSQITNFSFLLLNAIFGKRYTLQNRLYFTLSVLLLVILFTTCFVKIDTDGWQIVFFVIAMALAVCMNAVGALFQGALFGLVGMFPKEYTAAVVTGQALGGIFASVARIISIAVGANEVSAALFFFLTAIVFLFITMVCLYNVLTSDMFQHYCVDRLNEASSDEIPESLPQSESHWEESKRIYKEIWPLSVSVFAVFTITLAVFPAVAVHITSTAESGDWKDFFFQPVVTFLVFNIFDYLGRKCASAALWPDNGSRSFYLCVVGRIIFLPLLFFCNHPPSILPVFISSDTVYGAVIALFGFTGGYLATLCMIYGPRSVRNFRDAERAGSIMVASLGGGLLTGALLSFGFARLFV